MRQVVAPALVLVGISGPVAMGSSQAAAGQPGLRACALLTKDLVAKFAPNKSPYVFSIPPSEQSLGESSRTPQGYQAGSFLRTTTTFVPQANPAIDDTKFRFKAPS